MSATLSVEHVSKVYRGRSEELAILRDVSFEMSGGDSAAILGPSGSGKSTLLHILGALDKPSTGTVRVNGADAFASSERELARFRNQTVGFIFQDHHLLPQCSILENVLIPTLAGGRTTRDHEERARDLISRVGLSERIRHRPAELSGGERQRVAIARALMNHPTLLLCDEPTGNLDRRSATTVVELLLELHDELKNILVVVTHGQELASRLPRRYELLDGCLALAG
ncbi:MAG: ABC transporter ATP-binding protein [Planctomycetota bacterium]